MLLVAKGWGAVKEDVEVGSENKNATDPVLIEVNSEMTNAENSINWTNLVAIASKLQNHDAVNKEDYARTVLEVSKRISAENFRKSPLEEQKILRAKKRQMLSELTYSALMGSGVSLGVRMELIPFCAISDSSMSSKKEDREKWGMNRSQMMDIVLETWRDVDVLVRSLDITNVPEFSVSPPIEANLPDGGTPDMIKDPLLRKKYEDAIIRHEKRAAEFKRKYVQVKESKSFFTVTEFLVMRSYQRPPCEIGELEEKLDRYVKQKDVRDRIMENVRKAWPGAKRAEEIKPSGEPAGTKDGSMNK